LYATYSRTPALKRRLGWGLKDWNKVSLINKLMGGKNPPLSKRNKFILRQKRRIASEKDSKLHLRLSNQLKKSGTLLSLLWNCSFFSSITHIPYGSRIPHSFSNLP